MKKYIFLFGLALFILDSCTPAQVPSDESGAPSPPVAESEEEDTGSIYGSWLRTATYADGALVGTTPATLTINADGSYKSSSADCATSGTQEVTDNSIAVSMTQSNCPGNLALPYNVTYTFTIAEDGQSMNMMTANVKEDYVRAE